MSSALRYDIDELSRKILTCIALRYSLEETSKDFFTHPVTNEIFIKQKLIPLKELDPFHSMNNISIWRNKNINGYSVHLWDYTKEPKVLVYNKGNVKYLKDGYTRRVCYKRELWISIFIKNNGDVKLKNKNGIRTLSLTNISILQNYSVPNDIIFKLLTLKPHLKWAEDLFLKSDKIIENANHPENIDYILAGNNLWNTCLSLQEFIDNCKTRNYYLSARWFDGLSIKDILTIMLLPHDPSRYFSSAIEYLNYVAKTGTNFAGEKIIWGISNVRNISWRSHRRIDEEVWDISIAQQTSE